MKRMVIGLVAATLVIGVGIGGYAFINRPNPADGDRVCDGVPAMFGGCDQDQPSFAATTCREAAVEFGSQLNDRVMAVVNGPAVVDGLARSAQALHIQLLVIERLNEYLRNQHMVAQCSADQILDGAEPLFSPELRAAAPGLMSELETGHTYAEWRASVLKTLGVIDKDEDQPF